MNSKEVFSITLVIFIVTALCLVWYTKSEQVQEVKNRLSTEREYHNETMQNLQVTFQTLNQTIKILSQKTIELSQTYSTISNLTIDKNTLSFSLQNIKQQWNETKNELSKFHNAFSNLTRELNITRNSSLRNPSYSELITFLAEDKTNENSSIRYYGYNASKGNLSDYKIGIYDCTQFSRDLLHNASLKGFNCYFVEMDYVFIFSPYYYGPYGHTIVCFNTTDRGVIFVEPQTDELYYNLGYLEYFGIFVIMDLVIAW